MDSQPPKTLSDYPEFLTPRQVAALLQVKEVTVRLWIRRGLLKGIKIGAKEWRISKHEVLRFLGEPDV
jgi:excisionase family DNA binding protein